LDGGTYTIEVTDSNGCIASDSIEVMEPAALGLTMGLTDANCGQSNGYAHVEVSGGTTPYLYQWDDPLMQTTDTAMGLTAGNYSVVITDAMGCVDTGYATINDQGGAIITLDSLADISCNGASDGFIHLTTSGGMAPYNYSWSTADTTEDLNSIGAGAYSVSVTDDVGCVSVYDTTLIEPSPLSNVLTPTDETCAGMMDGQIIAVPIGGTSPYNYLWSDPTGQTNDVATGLSAGTYSVLVTDDNGCTDSASATISTITLTATAGPDTTICEGDAAQLSASGGDSYMWTPTTGLSDPNIANPIATPTASTNYSVIVSALGCPDDTAFATIVVNPTPIAYAGQDTIIPAGSSVNLSGSGGVNYNWTPPNGLDCDNCQNPTATPEATITYVLTVTDDIGCVGYDSIRIEVNNNTEVFFPQIFSPNATNYENKWAYIQGTGIEKVIELYVFDRWGEKVFENQNFQANDRTQGWNGAYKGEVMNPGVFVYYFKVQFYDGSEHFQSGDITLVH